MSPSSAGLAVEMYGMGVAVADYNNDGFPDILITAVGQNRLFQNTGKGHFVDVTEKAGLGGRSAFSTSALWFDYDRDGLLDLFVCNYVQWSPEHDVFCSVDGKHKSYCTPEAYHGSTCWLFRNRGNGTFEDVTAKSGIFDTTFEIAGRRACSITIATAGRIFSSPTIRSRTSSTATSATARSKTSPCAPAWRSAKTARRAPAWASMRPISTTPASPGIAITNFDNEMMALYRPSRGGVYADVAMQVGHRTGFAQQPRLRLRVSRCRIWMAIWIWWR